jgi:hypothetical protein
LEEWRYSSTLRLLYPQGKSHWYPLDRRLVLLNLEEEEKASQ